MPTICINMSAIEENYKAILRNTKEIGYHYMPVLKMVACCSAVTRKIVELGCSEIGAADIDEFNFFPDQPECKKILINISPIDRADDVVRIFHRSAFSSFAGLKALEEAAARQNTQHNAMLILDLGDWREGIPLENLPELLDQIRSAQFSHVKVMGIGVTLGCLHGVCPDEKNMKDLSDAAFLAARILPHPLERVSIGGSIFMDWIFHNPHLIPLPEGCQLELRAGDPLLLGYDMYRNIPFKAGTFRTDTFSLEASVVEVAWKTTTPPRHSVLNGQGANLRDQNYGKSLRALLDCGLLHTKITGLTPELPQWKDAQIVGFSGNYTVLDVTKCATPLAVGDKVSFHPDYWAVAKAFRMLTVRKKIKFSQTKQEFFNPQNISKSIE